MSLDRLRAYRRTLMGEELRTSYWRRLLQARRDLTRLGDLDGDLTLLREALTEPRGTHGRNAILALHPEGGMPILPQLPELWACEAGSQALVDGRDLTSRLTSAESVLSSYREALHRRLDRATADLVARYHEDPTSCFAALPKPR
jgi:anti-sigma-K factor RsiG